jgi:hypothetical protein
VEAMKKKRNDCLAQLKELAADRRKRPTLDNLKSQIEGLRTRLQYTQREVESNVRVTHFLLRDLTLRTGTYSNSGGREILGRKFRLPASPFWCSYMHAQTYS